MNRLLSICFLLHHHFLNHFPSFWHLIFHCRHFGLRSSVFSSSVSVLSGSFAPVSARNSSRIPTGSGWAKYCALISTETNNVFKDKKHNGFILHRLTEKQCVWRSGRSTADVFISLMPVASLYNKQITKTSGISGRVCVCEAAETHERKQWEQTQKQTRNKPPAIKISFFISSAHISQIRGVFKTLYL